MPLEEIPEISLQQVPGISIEDTSGISPEKHEGSPDGVGVTGQEQVFAYPSTGNGHPPAEIAETSSVTSSSGIPLSSELGVSLASELSVLSLSEPPLPLSSELRVPITRLPTEIIEKVFVIFVEHKCPLLCSLYQTGGIPINSERQGLHANSSLIQHKLQEEHASLLPLLCLSGYFYGIVSRLLSHREVYINGPQCFNQLTLFEQRRAGGFFIIKKTPIIESMFRKNGEPYTSEMRQNRRSLRGSPPGVRPYRSTHPMRYRSYDCTRSGTGWRKLHNPDSSWAPKGWDMFPGWLTGGSLPSGLYLFEDGADEEITGMSFSLAIATETFIPSLILMYCGLYYV